MLLTCGTVTGAEEDFATLVKRMQTGKPTFAERQQKLLAERYDLSDRPADDATISRGKPLQVGVHMPF